MTQPPERSIPAIELDRWTPVLEAASSQLRRIARDRHDLFQFEDATTVGLIAQELDGMVRRIARERTR